MARADDATGSRRDPVPTRPLAVSLVAFDGVPAEIALEAVAAAGATHAEPAYIAGTMLFTEADLLEPAAARLGAAMAAAGLGCVAVSAHMDCGAGDAAGKLARRLRFAAALGARFLITNTARRDRRDAFLRNAAEALRVAEQAGVALAFENPGHGPDDLLRAAADAPALLARLGSPWATLNYDVGNALTNSEGAVRPEADFAVALPLARHVHLKDMAPHGDRWAYAAIGEGSLDYDAVLPLLAGRPELPACVELPFGQLRRRGAAPVRGEAPRLEAVRAAVGRSVRRVRDALAVH